MYKVSIVTINLNNKEGLEKTVNSVINQTYFNNIEYIIIDGGSTDGSREFIEENKDKFSYWCSETDNGIFNAFNKSLNYLNGEYVLFLNSGDFLVSDNVIETAAKYLSGNTIVYGNEIFYSKTRKILQKYPDTLTERFFKTNALPHQSTFINIEYQKKHPYPENHKVIGDWSLLRESIMKENVSYLHIPLIVSTYEMNGFSGKNQKLFNEERKEYYKSMEKNSLNIFICSHKDFEKEVTNECYKIVDTRKNEIKECNHLDDRFYSEFLSFYNVSRYNELPNYVGFCHYRRYFNFLDEIPNMNEIFENYDCVTTKPLISKTSVKEQYAICHNLEDLYIIGGIIADKYPGYASMWHNFINGKIFIPYNMFIMRTADFQEYIKFIMDILDEYLKIVGTDINKRIYDNIEKYVKKYPPNNTVEYQYRIGGYLGERLTNLFLLTHFKKIKTYPVIITENKYGLKNNNI